MTKLKPLTQYNYQIKISALREIFAVLLALSIDVEKKFLRGQKCQAKIN